MASKPRSVPAACSIAAAPRSISSKVAVLDSAAVSSRAAFPCANSVPAARSSLVSSKMGAISSSAVANDAGNQSNSLHNASLPSTLTASLMSVPPMSMPRSSLPRVMAGSIENTGLLHSVFSGAKTCGSPAISQMRKEKRSLPCVSARTVRSFTFRHLPKPVRRALGKSVWNTASSDRAISAHSLSDGSKYRSMCSAPSEDKMLYSIAWT